MQQHIQDVVQPVFSRRATSALELLKQIAGVATPHHLNKLVNRFQSKIWGLSRDEQGLLRERLAHILSSMILQTEAPTLRLEAAGWLRLLVQAAYLSQPGFVFTTLVTAATHHPAIEMAERRAYLNMIVDCFWPFHQPYAAYSWEQLPPNATFLPLSALFALQDDAVEDALMTVFLQLPVINEPDLVEKILPTVLRWAASADADRRLRILPLLERMSDPAALAALQCLGNDQEQVVRINAQRTLELTRGA